MKAEARALSGAGDTVGYVGGGDQEGGGVERPLYRKEIERPWYRKRLAGRSLSVRAGRVGALGWVVPSSLSVLGVLDPSCDLRCAIHQTLDQNL